MINNIERRTTKIGIWNRNWKPNLFTIVLSF